MGNQLCEGIGIILLLRFRQAKREPPFRAAPTYVSLKPHCYAPGHSILHQRSTIHDQHSPTAIIDRLVCLGQSVSGRLANGPIIPVAPRWQSLRIVTEFLKRRAAFARNRCGESSGRVGVRPRGVANGIREGNRHMYESFYHLRQRPFAATADETFLVATDAVIDATTRLDRCVRQARGVAVVTGGAGMGKTLLMHCLAGRLEHDFGVIFVPNGSFVGPLGLLQFLLAEIGEPHEQLGETEMRLRLTAAAAEARATTRGTVVLLDETHRYSERLFEEVRLMANHIDSGEPLLRIVMAGQIALEDQLADGAQNGLNERIGEVVTLPRLTASESRDYLAGRVELASGQEPAQTDHWQLSEDNRFGCDDHEMPPPSDRKQFTTLDKLFDPEAIDVLVQACGGIPRCLNQLADHALLLGFVAERATVSESLVREALEDLKRLPLQWHDPSPARCPAMRSDEGACIDDGNSSSESFDNVVEIGALDDDEPGDFSLANRSSAVTGDQHREAVPAIPDNELPSPAEISEFAATDDHPSAETAAAPAEPPPSWEPVSDRFARLDADLAQQRWLADWEEKSPPDGLLADTSDDCEAPSRSQQSQAEADVVHGADEAEDDVDPSPEDVFRVTSDSSIEAGSPIDSGVPWNQRDQPLRAKETSGTSATLFRDLRRRQG